MPDDTPLERPDDPRDTAKLKAVLVVVAAIAFAISPAMTEPFTGFNPDQMPVPVESPPITPAGYAFAIWGAIYLWLVASAIFGLIKRDTAPDWDAMRWPLFASLAVGTAWIPVALTSPVWATILIFVMLGTALWALARAPRRDLGWAALPIGLYAGWLTAASFVALGTVAMGHDLVAQLTGSWIALVAALALAVAMMLRLRVATYAIAVAWAAIGITVANAADLPALAIAAALGAAAMLWLALKSRQTPARA